MHGNTFTAADGRTTTFTQNGLVFGYRTGDRVQVRYHPDDLILSPVIDRFLPIWTNSIVLAVFGLGFGLLGLFGKPN